MKMSLTSRLPGPACQQSPYYTFRASNRAVRRREVVLSAAGRADGGGGVSSDSMAGKKLWVSVNGSWAVNGCWAGAATATRCVVQLMHFCPAFGDPAACLYIIYLLLGCALSSGVNVSQVARGNLPLTPYQADREQQRAELEQMLLKQAESRQGVSTAALRSWAGTKCTCTGLLARDPAVDQERSGQQAEH